MNSAGRDGEKLKSAKWERARPSIPQIDPVGARADVTYRTAVSGALFEKFSRDNNMPTS